MDEEGQDDSSMSSSTYSLLEAQDDSTYERDPIHIYTREADNSIHVSYKDIYVLTTKY